MICTQVFYFETINSISGFNLLFALYCSYVNPAMSSLNVPNGEIDHVSYLSEHIGGLCLSDEYSDVVLVVEGLYFIIICSLVHRP